jgi:hypothetical protein
MTRLAFASPPLLLAFFAALAALGLWLTWALYFRANLPLGASARRALALLTALAWLALTWFGAGAALNRNPAVYHPPAVVLALDASESHAATGGREASEAALRGARAHYEGLGFKVVSLAFAESAAPFSGDAADAAGAFERFAGELTSFAALARALDSLQIPNLQAVLLASDGRASAAGAPSPSWSAPVYPLRIEGAEGHPEAQGERAEVDWTHPEEGADLALHWSAGRRARAITAEILEGERTLWTGTLRAEASRDAATEWAPTLSEFRLPAALTRSARPEGWTLRVRPAANPVTQNDRVEIRFKGLSRAREILARPLSSLEERGLVDALRLGDSGAVFAGDLALVDAGAEDVVWVRAGRSVPPGLAGAVIEYLPARGADDAAKGEELFGADARVQARGDGAEFLPAGVLRLGDLGAEGLRLRSPGRDVEALAWVEEKGRKGLLLCRKPGTRAFGIALPPLWRPGFSAGAAPEARAAASRWVRGAAAWARAHGRARAALPDPVAAGRAFALEVRFPPGEDDFKNIQRYDLYDNGSLLASARGASLARFDSVTLRAGDRSLSLRRGSRVVWTGAARVRAPRDLELGKLGVDGRALAEIAAASNGNIVRHEINSNVSWPVLPGGQARETRARSTPLAPAAVALAAALLLCAAWALRKRLQLD